MARRAELARFGISESFSDKRHSDFGREAVGHAVVAHAMASAMVGQLLPWWLTARYRLRLVLQAASGFGRGALGGCAKRTLRRAWDAGRNKW